MALVKNICTKIEDYEYNFNSHYYRDFEGRLLDDYGNLCLGLNPFSIRSSFLRKLAKERIIDVIRSLNPFSIRSSFLLNITFTIKVSFLQSQSLFNKVIIPAKNARTH